MAKNDLTITFKDILPYGVGDKATIIELEYNGRIRAILITDMGVQYKIRYFHNGTAEEEWFWADEIAVEWGYFCDYQVPRSEYHLLSDKRLKEMELVYKIFGKEKDYDDGK